jgi:O-succinylbenzoic acid--CoA ligase
MTNRLVALDLPGGPRFVDVLRRVWDEDDAAFVIDRRNPPPLRENVLAAIAPSAVVDAEGTEHARPGGRPVAAGDALVVATSGSMGVPKGVVLTHDAVAASAELTNRRLGVTADDHWLACLPLSHVGGLTVITKALLGATKLTVHPQFDADAVNDSGATIVSLVATALGRIDTTRFRTIVVGGSSAPPDLPSNVVTTYGMTETGSGVVYDGIPLDGVDVEVDAAGEIRVKSPTLLRAYRDGADPLVDGWFATGDLGAWNDEGRLVVHGRADDLIVTGGENVWPDVVEAALRTHPAVADVAVAGASDPEWGQVVAAFVVPAGEMPSLDSLRGHVKRSLPAFAAPRRLVIVAELPRTALGKLRRDDLAAHIAPERTPAPPSIT